jgi:Carboxypeptidase regulatory-like domain
MRLGLPVTLICSAFPAFYAAQSAAQQGTAESAPPKPSPFAAVVGAVVDSIHGGPLTGAIVILNGTDRQATVDSTGRFRIDSVPPGDYALAVFHPLLDSLGIALGSKSITFPAGVTTSVLMGTPSAPGAIAEYCTEAERQRGPGAVIGRVLAADADKPMPDAVVRYTSVSIVVGKDIGLKRSTFTKEAKVNASGVYTLCGLPMHSGGSVRATRGQFATGDVLADVSRRQLAIVDLRLDTLKLGTAVIVGRVVDEKGVPIPHVDMALAGTHQQTTTNDSGSFALRNLPAGSQTIEVRKVGFLAADTALTLSARQPVQFQLTLHAAAVRLGTVAVQAARQAALERVGFDHRKKTGQGHFLTAEDIHNRGATLFSDIARTIPGLLVVRMPRTGQTVIMQGRGMSITSRGCVAYSIDGAPYQDIPRGSIDTFVHPEDIIGLEVYQSSEAPGEINIITPGSLQCALVVIWTRATSAQ